MKIVDDIFANRIFDMTKKRDPDSGLLLCKQRSLMGKRDLFPVFLVDEPAQMMLSGNDDEQRKTLGKSLQVSLPFTEFIVAFRYYSRSTSSFLPNLEEAAIVMSHDVETDEANTTELYPLGTKYTIGLLLLLRGDPPGPVILGQMTAYLDKSGTLLPARVYPIRGDWQDFVELQTLGLGDRENLDARLLAAGRDPDSTEAKQFSAIGEITRTILMSLVLLNCKNVHTREQPCDQKLAKRYHERHGHKRPRYYVLDIEPMKQKFRDANGGKDGISLAKALHICRGHFKNFDDKPLFGKLKGTYWWQPHVRGTEAAGVVDKDYRIKL
jgi:hypothetical protein